MNHIKAHNIGFLTEKWNVRKQNTRQLSEDITEAWNKEGLGVDPSIDFYGPKATFMYDKNETVSDQAIIAGARWFMNETAENNGSKDIGDEDITKNWQEHQIIDWIENNFENGLDGLISDGNDYVPKPKVVREKWNVKPLNEMEGKVSAVDVRLNTKTDKIEFYNEDTGQIWELDSHMDLHTIIEKLETIKVNLYDQRHEDPNLYNHAGMDPNPNSGWDYH